MNKKILPAAVLVLTVYLLVLLPTLAVAYRLPPGYGGTPIKYGGWLIGQVIMEIRHRIQTIPWVKITITSTDGALTKVTKTNEYGNYKIYLPPGDYNVTATYARYVQTYNITIREDQIFYRLNIYIERPDAPEFQDHLATKK